MASEKSKLAQEADPLKTEEGCDTGVQPVHRRVIVRKLDRRALHQPQGPDSGINAIIGRWPGDEIDEEEFIALIEEIS